MMRRKLENPIHEILVWADGLLDSRYGSITSLQLRYELGAMRDHVATALEQIEPLLLAIHARSVRDGINLTHACHILLKRVIVAQLPHLRATYAHHLSDLHRRVLGHIEAEAAQGCERLERLKSYFTLVASDAPVERRYFYLPVLLRDVALFDQIETAPVVGEVYANADGLRQALALIAENRRHAGDGATLSVRAVMAEFRQIAIHISDDGPGIAPEHLPHIFEPFYQADPYDPGLGLGLTIAQGIMKRQGGDVYAKCHNRGGVTITLLVQTKL